MQNTDKSPNNSTIKDQSTVDLAVVKEAENGCNTVAQQDQLSLIERFLASKAERTDLAYRQDLKSFGLFLGETSLDAVSMRFIILTSEEAKENVAQFVNFLLAKGLRTSSINRRVSTICAFAQFAYKLKVIAWTLEAKDFKVKHTEPVSIPTASVYQRLLNELDLSTPKGIRDVAILRLLFDFALRRSEIVSMDFPESVDLKRGIIQIQDKKKTVELSLPEETKQALIAWIKVRGTQKGALFINFDPAHKGGRLTDRSVDRNVIKPLAIMLDLHTSPHYVRHAVIVNAIKKAKEQGLEIRSILEFARNQHIKTLNSYVS